jgi:hypothetical protein
MGKLKYKEKNQSHCPGIDPEHLRLEAKTFGQVEYKFPLAQ